MKTANMNSTRNPTVRKISPLALALCYFVISSVDARASDKLSKFRENFDADCPGDSGYQLIFDSRFDGPDALKAISFEKLPSEGSMWYSQQFFGWPQTPRSSVAIEGKSLTIRHGMIASAAPSLTTKGYVGRSFGPGAYFEIDMAFEPRTQGAKSSGWPAIWAMPIEHMVGKGLDHQPSAPTDYVRFIEDDLFEDDTADWAGAGTYGTTLHEWYGRYHSTCREQSFCQSLDSAGHLPGGIVVNAGRSYDPKKFHRYGQLWIVGRESMPSAMIPYLDGVKMSNGVQWSGEKFDSPVFRIANESHLVLLLSTADQLMRIRSVRVWQKSEVGESPPSACAR